MSYNYQDPTQVGYASAMGAWQTPAFPMQDPNAYSPGVTVAPAIAPSAPALGYTAPVIDQPAIGGGTAPAVQPNVVPEAETTGGWLSNFGNLSDLMKGLGSIGNVWAGIQANKIAADTLAFNKDTFEKNYANSLASYNTALADRAEAEFKAEGKSAAELDAYIKKNKLG